ncbi:VIR protein [Plasmodium vivax]|uniref:VIR protein n=1 Tax=Plasmodium vivax TaxID=5855 RepID=A0A1G4E211_PLAVI|nr:VIR protein [Plasmodium vivax]
MPGIKETEWDESDVREFLIEEKIGTGIFYEELDTSPTSNHYDEYCGSRNNPIGDSKDVRIICATLLNYLESKYSASDHTGDTYDVCKLLNYWVYKRLNTVLYSKVSRYIDRVHGYIVLKWNSFNEDKLEKLHKPICKPIDNIVAYDNWEKIKELYEYYVDYSIINKNLEFYPQLCEKFYKYVKSKKPLYTYFKERCTRKDINMCPEFFDQYEKYDPEKVLPHPYCKDVIMQESAASSPSVSQLGKVLLGNEPNSEEADDRKMTFDPPNLSVNPHTVTKFGNVFLGVVATTMTSGALYRFTPLGGMIRNGLGWNTNNMRNFNGGDIRLYDYASDSFNPYPGEEHYIGYHPA